MLVPQQLMLSSCKPMGNTKDQMGDSEDVILISKDEIVNPKHVLLISGNLILIPQHLKLNT